MRTTILLLILSIFLPTTLLASVDWSRLNLELEYLKSGKDSNQDNSRAIANPSKPQALKELQFQRKSPIDTEGEAQLDQIFDSVNTRLASPIKEEPLVEQTQAKREITKPIRMNGSISKDQFEGLVDK